MDFMAPLYVMAIWTYRTVQFVRTVQSHDLLIAVRRAGNGPKYNRLEPRT